MDGKKCKCAATMAGECICGAWEQPEDLKQQIASLKAELEKHRWIPVSERLPESRGFRQVTDGLSVWSTSFVVDKQKFYKANNIITHWREIDLPESEE